MADATLRARVTDLVEACRKVAAELLTGTGGAWEQLGDYGVGDHAAIADRCTTKQLDVQYVTLSSTPGKAGSAAAARAVKFQADQLLALRRALVMRNTTRIGATGAAASRRMSMCEQDLERIVQHADALAQRGAQ